MTSSWRAMILGVILPVTSASAAPTVWFCPLDPSPRPYNSFPGSTQYMDLFAQEAPWKTAASRTNVFKIYPGWIEQAADQDLQRQFADLNRRGIALALEYGPLTRSTTCSEGITGEGSNGQNLVNVARRIFKNGGTLRYLAMDEPVQFSVFHSACRWTPEQAAANAASNLRPVLKIFPGLKIGDIEGLGNASDGRSLSDVMAQYRRFIDAFQKEFGFPMAFFHADVAWTAGAFPANLVALHKMLREERLPMGIIYDGSGTEASDADWIRSARNHMEQAEDAVGSPDDIIFQSWHAHPLKLLPETDPESFTWLINQYFRVRTTMTSSRSDRRVSGTLLDADGRPIAGATIRVSALPASKSGPSVAQTYTYDGQIPSQAEKAIFAVRVNTECGCSGAADFQVSAFRLQTGNGDLITRTFGSAMNSVDWPTLHAQTTAAGQSSGIGIVNHSLHVSATSGQKLMLNGTPFPVHGGESYHGVIESLIQPKSFGSGNFSLIFLDAKKEISRVVIPLKEIPILVGTATTDALGHWQLSLPSQDDAVRLEVEFAGGSTYWSAREHL